MIKLSNRSFKVALVYQLPVHRLKVISLYCNSQLIFANEELNIAIQIVNNHRLKSFPLWLKTLIPVLVQYVQELSLDFPLNFRHSTIMRWFHVAPRLSFFQVNNLPVHNLILDFCSFLLKEIGQNPQHMSKIKSYLS